MLVLLKTHRSTCQIARQTVIHQSSVSESLRSEAQVFEALTCTATGGTESSHSIDTQQAATEQISGLRCQSHLVYWREDIHSWAMNSQNDHRMNLRRQGNVTWHRQCSRPDPPSANVHRIGICLICICLKTGPLRANLCWRWCQSERGILSSGAPIRENVACHKRATCSLSSRTVHRFTVLVKPLACCSVRHRISFRPTCGESVSRHVSVLIMDILNTSCEQTLANNLHFSCVFGSNGFCPWCQILLCWCLMVDGPTLLNCIP